ncbi:hypothetical protein BST81_25170 [Leptolyngbya sp. 'hensonii']|uniref:DegT/DnrJ/EryC1/StrS family aminotransferase n=1 Tax=Leptolyngbya sp. 'hensonii' TaxID=1922337 RepID=UPI0009500276|nr:DegT/DnrJ/EryC1/StrS family aminotransferase [Leptolyngbya sp. 'hensonii']OLP15646.1 hypothetical protein BST81_25170 [Leptolyngbya sp. 'hensonii']
MIPHNRPTLGPEEEAAVIRVIRSGWLAQGQEVQAFEAELCRFLGLPEHHAVALTSGTAALFLALWALQGRGKKVAFPVYTCSSIRHAIAMAGGEEVQVDITPGTPNLALEQLAQTEATVAIVPHMYGLPLDLTHLQGVTVIEDCAQALGAVIHQVPAGLQGHIGIFSFYATKLITSGGQGGMVVSRDRSLIDAIRDYREFDCRQDDRQRFNFQMTDLQAAIGRVQLRRLPQFLTRRAELFHRYQQAGLPLLDSPLNPVRFRAIVQTTRPSALIDALAAASVKAIIPIETWELLGDPAHFPVARALTQETVSLPLYPSLQDAEMDLILNSLLTFMDATP